MVAERLLDGYSRIYTAPLGRSIKSICFVKPPDIKHHCLFVMFDDDSCNVFKIEEGSDEVLTDLGKVDFEPCSANS